MIPNKSGKVEETTTKLVATNGKSLKLFVELQLTLEVEKRYFHVELLWGKKLYIQ